MFKVLRFSVACVLLSQMVLSQNVNFNYQQQYAGGVQRPVNTGPSFVKDFDDNRAFRFKPLESSVIDRQELNYPTAERVAPIVTQQPINPAPIPLVRAHVEEIPPKKIIKKVKVIKEKVRVQQPNIEDDTPITRAENQISDEEEAYLEDQAKSAHYSFSSSIQDSINDHAITRSETRDGLALKGMYSYSDGFYKRTVHYEADEDGYRVVK